MSLLVETIRISDGIAANLAFHEARMIRSMHDLFCISGRIDLRRVISVPSYARKGIFKCRVEYDMEIGKVEFLPYSIRPVNRLKLVWDDEINYSYKYVARTEIDKLMERRGACDDILIVKKGMITDTSYANIVLLDKTGTWITPTTFLLPGTRRASLLRLKEIRENPVKIGDLNNYSAVKLINSMIGLDDTTAIPIENILPL